ncbi:KAT8 regulatory NSL complex subunit 2 isoform X2 [Cylas formicarius]|uniref:KAT8 regulatory NSL complex subunit 2 isoform X2 n=1 Tax=Cylas formicarius TaxID=197179 RepID=UPI002958C1B9|nr:KAT8 regulatory NSL complex subunit 2 isoform X2 [Cylas formicarius]
MLITIRWPTNHVRQYNCTTYTTFFTHSRMEHEQVISKVQASSAQDAVAVLRAEIIMELQNKQKCSYGSYECTQLSIEGYKYCLKHILSDKNAPFKQCTYIYQSSGKRCHLPAPKGDKKEYGYCSEHALKSTLLRNRQNSKCPSAPSAEHILHSLAHYVKRARSKNVSSSSFMDESERNSQDEIGELKATKCVDPFKDLDASAIHNAQCNEVLDLCSDSESDVEASTCATVWHDANADSSDNESIDSEEEDVLKHANVYTAEEISLLTRDKLVRLQSLYIEQYRYLQYLLKEKRRKYIHSLKREKETCCNIFNQVHDNPKEQRLYKKLKQYNKYHRTYGEEAILSKKLHDLRAKISDGLTVKSSGHSKCIFTEGGVKCVGKSIPMAKHCRKHILEDQSQVLFKSCGKMNGDVECTTPVEAIFDDSTCHLHMDVPPIRSYNQPRNACSLQKESESDADDTIELPPYYAMPKTENVKSELIDYSLTPELPKMETLPSILFEETTESIPSELSDFSKNFEEDKTLDDEDLEINVTSRSVSETFMDQGKSVPDESISDDRQVKGTVLNEKEGNIDVEDQSDEKDNIINENIEDMELTSNQDPKSNDATTNEENMKEI